VDGEDVLPLVEQPAPHLAREVADEKVLSHRVIVIVLEAADLKGDVDQLKKDRKRQAEEDVAHKAPARAPTLKIRNKCSRKENSLEKSWIEIYYLALPSLIILVQTKIDGNQSLLTGSFETHSKLTNYVL
jgi:hypothetical protein